MFFFFFFSSRRRHTRSTRDWSSDVCSSDLVGARMTRMGRSGNGPTPGNGAAPSAAWARSEERRVGKECRSRRAADHEKKKRKNERAGADRRNISIEGRPSRRVVHSDRGEQE